VAINSSPSQRLQQKLLLRHWLTLQQPKLRAGLRLMVQKTLFDPAMVSVVTIIDRQLLGVVPYYEPFNVITGPFLGPAGFHRACLQSSLP